MPIRILHVLGGLGLGGAESMVMNLYRHMDREKIQFDFVIYENGKLDFYDEIISLGGQVFKSPHFNGVNALKYIKFWVKFLNAHQEYGVIHGHVRSTASIYLLIASHLGRETIAHSHSTSNGTGISALVKKTLQYPIRFISDYQMACSLDAGKWLFGRKVLNRNSFFIIKNAINMETFKFSPAVRAKKRKDLGLEHQFVLCNVGRLVYPKNHEFMLNIYEELIYQCPEAVLVLVGEGELEKVLKQKVKEKGLEKGVLFLGNRSDVSEILCAADIFLFPSRYEGLGIAAVEAQAAGLMTLCSERIPKEVFITPYIQSIPLSEKPEKWIHTIMKYRKGYEHKCYAEKIKQAGYNIDSSADKMQKFYLNLDMKRKDVTLTHSHF